MYNKPKSFFYLDPPYYGTEKYYQVQFKTEDHIRLKETLDTVTGKFLLSYNDVSILENYIKVIRLKQLVDHIIYIVDSKIESKNIKNC